MTTIIGIQGEGYTVLGADSRVSHMDENGYVLQQQTLPDDSSKLIAKKGYILGVAGDIRAINILQHTYEPPPPPRTSNPDLIDKHVTNRLIPSIRECFDDEGYSPPDTTGRDHKAQQNSIIIISVKARLYVIDSDYSWAPDKTGLYTIGTGHQYAKAALHILTGNTTKNLPLKQAQHHTQTALQVAATHDIHTGPPHHILTQTVRT